MKTKQRGPICQKSDRFLGGFTLIEVLLVVIAITLIIGIGFYIFTTNKQSKGTRSTAQNISNSSKSPTDQSGQTKKKYLNIKELGIKFELTDKLKDAKYLANNHNNVYVSVGYFDNLEGFNGCRAVDGGGLIAISYAKIGDDYFGSPITEDMLQNNFKAVKVNDTYYWFTANSQAPCWDIYKISDDNPNIEKISEYKKALTDQQPTITKL